MCSVVMLCENRWAVSAYSKSELEGEYYKMGEHKKNDKTVHSAANTQLTIQNY